MSTRQLTDDNKVVTDQYVFDAFGILLHKDGDTINNYLYTGEQYDPNIGFYYLRARYFDMAVGRFITVDPFKGAFYEPRSLHKYIYCLNDPVNRSDHSGMFSTGEHIAMAAIYIPISLAFFVMIYNYWRGCDVYNNNPELTKEREDDYDSEGHCTIFIYYKWFYINGECQRKKLNRVRFCR